MFDDHLVLVRSDAPLSAEIDGETVMFDADRGSYYALGRVGTRIWELLEEPRAVGALLTTLVDEFEVDEPTCRQDVATFLDELDKAGLITVQP